MKDQEYSKSYSLLLRMVISHGKKRKAEKVVQESFYLLRDSWKVSPAETLKRALYNVSPAVRIQTRRRGSQRVRVPIPLSASQRISLGARLLRAAAREKGLKDKKPFSFRLAQELYNASNKKGSAFSKAQSINREGVDNQPNSHLRWF